MSEFEAEAKSAEAAGRAPAPDTTMQALSQLVARIRSDASVTGEVNVPQSLAALKAEAAQAGFGNDAAGAFVSRPRQLHVLLSWLHNGIARSKLLSHLSDPAILASLAGIAAYMQQEARAAAELDIARRERGLGGLFRRTLESSAVLRNKAATADAAAARPFRDPAMELGYDSLLVRRVQAARARMEQQQ